MHPHTIQPQENIDVVFFNLPMRHFRPGQPECRTLYKQPAYPRNPFILASRIVLDAVDATNEADKAVLEDASCLWDTGAEISLVLASLLSLEMRKKPDNRYFN